MKDETKADQVTMALISAALTGICEQMSATLIHSSQSPNITERHDCSCSLYTPAGEMTVMAEHIPVHLGVMPRAIEHMLLSRKDTLRPGQLFLTNDPYAGGNHLPDLILACPIYVDDRLMGFAAALAHHNDVGGVAPRSMPGDATEIYQEGLRIPPVHVGDDWSFNPAVLQIVMENSRLPDQRIADLNAQLSALQTAQDEHERLCRRYGSDVVASAQQRILDASEHALRARLSELPDGAWSAETTADSGGDLVSIRVKVTKTGDNLTVDFGGTGPQTRSPYNAPLSNTMSAVTFALQVLLGGDIPANSGFYRPIEVIVPPGSILNPTHPAAISAATQVSYHTFDSVQLALADLRPDQAIAGSGSAGVFSFGGNTPTGGAYAYGGAIGGGLGGALGRPGESGVKHPLSNTRDISVEALEEEFPIVQLRYELIEGSNGPGEWPGGLGIRYLYRLTNHSVCSFQTSFMTAGPAGIRGGTAAPKTSISVHFPNGDLELVDRFRTIECPEDTLVSIESPGGGGYGTASAIPSKREGEAVA